MRVMEMHAPMRVVQRGKGRTATAAAAYRAADRIECERTGQVHDYTKKRGVEDTEIHTAGDAPEWARDRHRLWNAAEMREKHPRAQTAREVEVGFPHEFNAEQRKEAGRGIAKLFVTRYGSAADIAWHEPGRKGDQRNYHAHILFTNRAVTADGWAKNKRNALDDITAARDENGETLKDRDGKTVTNAQLELKSLRGAIAGVMNSIAARDRVAVFVEHLSFEERGLDREATQHLGPDATEMERRGETTNIGDKNRSIEARNASREELQAKYDNVIDFALARRKRDRQEPWTNFYRDTQSRRAALDAALQRQYAQQELDARNEWQDLRQQRSGRNVFARLWHRATGRKRLEDERMDGLNSTLHIIEMKKREAFEQFEGERRARLDAMKSEMANADREDREKFAAFLQAQESSSEAGTNASEAFGLAEWEYDDVEIHSNDIPAGQELPAHEGTSTPQAKAETARRIEAFKERMRSSSSARDRGTDRSIG